METNSVLFVEPGVKINSEYHCVHVLRRCLLPVDPGARERQYWTLLQDELYLTLSTSFFRRILSSSSQTNDHRIALI